MLAGKGRFACLGREGLFVWFDLFWLVLVVGLGRGGVCLIVGWFVCLFCFFGRAIVCCLGTEGGGEGVCFDLFSLMFVGFGCLVLFCLVGKGRFGLVGKGRLVC